MLGATCAALAGGAAVNLAAIAATRAETIIPKAIPASDRLSVATDPIFALIERHRAMLERIEATNYDWSEGDDDLAIDVAKARAVERAILEAPFASLAGIAAAVRYVNSLEVQIFSEPDGDEFLNRLADSLERMGALS